MSDRVSDEFMDDLKILADMAHNERNNELEILAYRLWWYLVGEGKDAASEETQTD